MNKAVEKIVQALGVGANNRDYKEKKRRRRRSKTKP